MENSLKAGNGEKMENRMENCPELHSGKNGPKMGSKWRKNGKFPRKFISGPFLPLSSSGQFSIWFSIFAPFPAFRLFSNTYRPDRIPTLVKVTLEKKTSL